MRLPAAARRQQLIDTAIEVFARNGYHETSMNDVAIAAGVTKPVLYQHFPSKRELYRELMCEIGQQLRDGIAKATAEAEGPRQQLEFGLDAYFRFVADHNDAFTMMFGSGTGTDEELLAEAALVQSDVADLIAELIDIEHLSTEHRRLLAFGVVGMAESCCSHWLRQGIEIDAAELAAQVSRLAWAGLRGIR